MGLGGAIKAQKFQLFMKKFQKRIKLIPASIGLFSASVSQLICAQPPEKPNIIIIYATILGYGDVSCYGATRLRTPNIDGLANQGLRFTNAHCTSATSTPSRYSLLTGEYAWRRKGTNVLPEIASAIILPERITIATVMKNAGYTTGVWGNGTLALVLKEGPTGMVRLNQVRWMSALIITLLYRPQATESLAFNLRTGR